MGILQSLIKQITDRNPAQAPVSPRETSKMSNRRTVTYEELVNANEAYIHPVVFRCLNKIASSVQFISWYAEADPDVPGSKVTQAEIDAINALLDDPNDSMGPEQFRYWLASSFALFGRVTFKVGVDIKGTPNALYPLDPQFTENQTNGKGVVTAYKFGSGQNKETIPTRRTAEREGSKKGYGYQIYTPNLQGATGPENNVSPLRAMGLPKQVITLLLQRGVDTASGHPNRKYVITSERTLTEKQKDALKEHLDNSTPGEEESGQVLFLYNTKVEIHRLDNDLSDIHSKVPVDDMTRMIAGLFGIPVALMGLGAADGSKFAGNYVESRLTYWEDTIVPMYLSPFAAGMTRALARPGIRIVFDLDSIPALQAGRVSLAKELTGVQFLTKNEKREMLGYAPRTDGDVYDVTNAQQPATQTRTQAEEQ